jgi:hypothetical protein
MDTRPYSSAVFVDNVFDDTYLRWSDMEPRRTAYGSIFPQRAGARFHDTESNFSFGDPLLLSFARIAHWQYTLDLKVWYVGSWID